jgi:hypothetical protein
MIKASDSTVRGTLPRCFRDGSHAIWTERIDASTASGEPSINIGGGPSIIDTHAGATKPVAATVRVDDPAERPYCAQGAVKSPAALTVVAILRVVGVRINSPEPELSQSHL